jgi:hypothetical protein
MDFPWPNLENPYVSTFTTASVPFSTAQVAELTIVNYALAAWPLANRAFYIPFTLDQSALLQQVFWENGGVAGNTCVAVYDVTTKARLVTTGSTANAGATVQIVNITDTLLTAGCYYAGMVVDTVTTETVWSSLANAAMLRCCGCAQETLGSAVMPATATPVSQISGFLPMIGLSFQAVM